MSVHKISAAFIFILVALILLPGSKGFAQGKVEAASDTATHVNKYPGTWSLRVYGIIKAQTLNLRNTETDATIRYLPRNIFGVGAGISWKFLVLDLGVTLGAIEGFSNRFDFQGNVFLGKSLFDIYLQAYRGFEVIEPEEVMPPEQQSRDDIRTLAFGINYYYSFKGDRMSMRSVFVGDHQQLYSIGSPLVGAFTSVFLMKADSSIIPEGDDRFSEESQLKNIRLSSTGLMAGYAYNFIFPNNMYLFISATAGGGINGGNLKNEEEWYSPPWAPVGKLQVRTALGWNGPKTYLALSWQNDYFWIDLGTDRFRYALTKIKAAVGFRFWHKRARGP